MEFINDDELSELLTPACQVYAAVVARGTSATAVGRALSRPPFGPDAFVAALMAIADGTAAQPSGFSIELRNLALLATMPAELNKKLEPAAAAAVAEAAVWLVPQSALVAVEGKDEL